VRSDSYFNNLLKQAKGVVIVPHLFKGAIGIGASGGTGVFLAKQSNGQWSDPAFLSLGSISIGPQAGAKEGPVVMLLMTSKAMHDFTQSNNFSLNANAGLTVINYSAKGQGGLGKGDIVVWSGAGGAFAGASVSGADITADTTQDVNYYGKASTTAAIIKGQVHNAEAKVLVNALPA
jgi:lipid-binding SYLF domain-containing protein